MLQQEYNDPGAKQWALNFGSISTERLLPMYKDWVLSRKPQLLVYCPVLCQFGHFVAQQLKIPDVSLLTTAGPGFFDAAMAAHPGATAAGLISTVAANAPNQKAVQRIREQLEMPELSLNTKLDEPLIGDYYTNVNLVTTTEELADVLNPADTAFYRTQNKSFIFVGPLLESGTKRAGGMLTAPQQEHPQDKQQDSEHATVMQAVRTAATAGRDLLYISMGTVITGDSPEHGWHATDETCITGKQLCQAVYRGMFERFGSAEVGEGALIIVSLGPQPDALEGLVVPRNALCATSVPQVDLLQEGRPKVFLTNGGQNSLMESMSVGTPVVVCPGFGDQSANAMKVQSQGWGLKVDRPREQDDSIELVLNRYREAVISAAHTVVQDEKFAARASAIEKSLKHAPGVDGATRVLLQVAAGANLSAAC